MGFKYGAALAIGVLTMINICHSQMIINPRSLATDIKTRNFQIAIFADLMYGSNDQLNA
jgi:hypothetical protein